MFGLDVFILGTCETHRLKRKRLKMYDQSKSEVVNEVSHELLHRGMNDVETNGVFF